MTELEQFKAMLDRAGVVYDEGVELGKSFVTIEEGKGPHNTGYIRFSTTVAFDDAGNLLNVGAWED